MNVKEVIKKIKILDPLVEVMSDEQRKEVPDNILGNDDTLFDPKTLKDLQRRAEQKKATADKIIKGAMKKGLSSENTKEK